MNAETDVMHIAMKKAISSKFVAMTSHTSVTCKFGFFFVVEYIYKFISKCWFINEKSRAKVYGRQILTAYTNPRSIKITLWNTYPYETNYWWK